ncbi:MAG: hypothetical protein J6D31_10345 [Clostridia bacterium]|nr:hypothetical protein [Clostridia bacterium]
MKKFICIFILAILLFCSSCSHERSCYEIMIDAENQWFLIITEEDEACIRECMRERIEESVYTGHPVSVSFSSVADMQRAFSEESLSIEKLFLIMDEFPRDEQERIPLCNMNVLFIAAPINGIPVFHEQLCQLAHDTYTVSYDLGTYGRASYQFGSLTWSVEEWLNWKPGEPYKEEWIQETGSVKWTYGNMVAHRIFLEDDEKSVVGFQLYTMEEANVEGETTLTPLAVQLYAEQDGIKYQVKWQGFDEMPSKETLLSLGIEPFVPADAA